MSGLLVEREPRAPETQKPRLCVVLACHEVVCALPIENIDRLVLPEAVEAAQPAPGGGKQRADREAEVPDVVRVGDRHFAAWDLGVLFGLGPVSGTWVLLSLMHEGREVALALRTGPCYAVQSLRNLVHLPGEVFAERRGALTDGFATAAVARKKIETEVGVLIDPAGLWTKEELQISSAVLDAAVGRGGGAGGARR